MVKSFESTKVQDDYLIVRHHGKRYLISYAEIAEFSPETEHFKDVYEVVGEIDRGQRSHKFLIEQIKDASLLETITETWENRELDDEVSRHDVVPPSDFRG